MTRKVQWNNDAQPLGSTLDQILYQIRCADAGEGLLMDAVTPEEITEDSDGILTFDALVSPYARLERKMELLRGIMERAGDKVKPVAMQITEPFKQRGVAHVAVIFELSDGQTVSIYFHNPDGSPGKMAPTDEVISWKWLLNKKDITIVVAPERGSDLNVREVARRIMRLSEKNSAAFQRVNARRAERMGAIETLKGEVQGLEAELSAAQKDLELAKLELEEHEFAQIEAAKNKPKNLEMTRSEWESKVMTALKNRVKSDPYEWIGGGEMDDRNLTGVVEAQWVAQAEPAEAAKVLQEAGKQWDADKAKAMEEAQKAEQEAARKAAEEQEPAATSDKWWDSSMAEKYAAVYLIGKSRSSEYVTLEAKGSDYEAKATQSGMQQAKTGSAQDIYDWLASQVLTGMGHAMQGKSLTADEMTAKLKLVKGTDILGVAKPAKVKAVTKKEAREAYESLEWCLNHRLEYGNASLAKLANVGEGEILGYLQACEDLIARGLPEMPSHMNMQKLVDRVRSIMEKVKVAKARASGDFGQLGELIEGVAKELQELGWKLTQDGKPNTNPDEETEGGQWAVESPRGTEIVMSPDSRMLDEIDFNGSFDYIARVGDDPAEVAKGIDAKDWAENSDDAPYSDDGIVDDEDSEFFGKSLDFVRANLDLEKAAAAAGATLVWGDFTASLHTGSLFDGATHFGVSAQIGKDGQIAARAAISEGGFVTLYTGAAGDAVALESGKYKDIAAKVAELVAAMPAPQSEPAPQPEPQPLPEPEKPADTPVARMNALLKAKPKGEIRSDDPDAIAKLQAKLAYLEGYSELMRSANKLVRKNDRAGLAAMGFPENVITGMFEKDFAGRIGFPDYELKNNNAEARRTRQRLEELQRQQQAKEPMPQPESTTTGAEYRYALVYRPAGIGATPAEGFLRVDPAPAGIASVARHGVAVYSRELTEQELKSFELRRVHTESERAAAVEAIAQHFAGHKYAANYYEYVQEGDAAMLEMVMRQEIEQQYPFDAFSDADTMPKEAGERFATLMKAKQPEPEKIQEDGEFSIGTVRLVAATYPTRSGKRVWGIRVVENGKEISAADGGGAWFKNTTKAAMIEDLERMYATITKIGDATKNENTWRKSFDLPPLESPAASADPERAKAVQYLQGIVDGTTDPLTVDFDNLEALHANYGSDPEVAALFEKAADVVANAALAATA